MGNTANGYDWEGFLATSPGSAAPFGPSEFGRLLLSVDDETGALNLIGAEPALGNPAGNGYVLSSTTGGTRSWISVSTAALPSQTGNSGKFLGTNGTSAAWGSLAQSDISGLIAALALKASIASPTFTGTPAAPTAASGTNTTQLATTAFVQAVKSDLLNGAGGAYDTLKELQDLIVADESTATALATTVAGKLAKSSNLSDLTSVSTARTNLGLGDSATRNVGTTTGTIAAGDIAYRNTSQSYRDLSQAAVDGVDQRLYGLSATSGTLNLYSTLNHGTSTYVRNTSNWAATTDLTSVSVWNSSAGGTPPNYGMRATLISPRHVLLANHYMPTTGTTFRWVAADGTVVTRTLSSVSSLIGSDIRIGKLSSDVPASIRFARVLNLNEYFAIATGSPAVFPDQFNQLFVADLDDVQNTLLQFSPPADTQRLAFWKLPVAGDSSNPMFLLLNDEAVLLGAIHTDSDAVPVSRYLDDINSAMTSLGGGYQLTETSFRSPLSSSNPVVPKGGYILASPYTALSIVTSDGYGAVISDTGISAGGLISRISTEEGLFASGDGGTSVAATNGYLGLVSDGQVELSGATIKLSSLTASRILGTDASNNLVVKTAGIDYLAGNTVLPANTTASSNQFFTAYNSTTGAFTKAQPAFSNLSDRATNAQLPLGAQLYDTGGTLRFDAENRQLVGYDGNGDLVPFLSWNDEETLSADQGITAPHINSADFISTSGYLQFGNSNGSCYIQSTWQSTKAQVPPASATTFWFDSTGRLSWMKQNGFVAGLDANSLTADRVFTLPDTAGTLAIAPFSSASASVVTAATNTTGAQNLSSVSITAGALNTANKNLRVHFAGVHTVNNTSTLTISVKLGSTTLVNFTSGSITATQTNAPWGGDIDITTVATGASGTVEVHGMCGMKATGSGGATSVVIDGNSAAIGTIDLTGALTLQVTATYSANGATPNSCSQRQLTARITN